MAGTLRILIISIGFCCSVVAAAEDADQQALENCHQEVEAIAKCLGDHHEEPPMNDSMKQEFEQCFTNAGCEAPKPPGEGHGSAKGRPKGGPGGKSSASGGKSKGGLNEVKCFMAVQKSVAASFVQCLQQKGVNLTAGGRGAKGAGDHHPPPHGGPFDHHGPSSPHEHAQEFLANQCQNDSQKAQQVNSCLAGLHERKARSKYEAMCAAENTCKQQHDLSETCKAKLQNFAQALCQCKQELQPEVKQAFQSAKACKNQPPPPDSSQEENCSEELKSPCEQGFDAFYAKHSKHQG